jgi:hypothetical protein
MNHASGSVKRQTTREPSEVHAQTTAKREAMRRKTAGAHLRAPRSSHKDLLLAG